MPNQSGLNELPPNDDTLSGTSPGTIVAVPLPLPVYGSPLYMLTDFAMGAISTFRQATPTEAIQQDLLHMLQDAQALGEPATQPMTNDVRGRAIDLLSGHPYVTSIENVVVEAGTDNRTGISVYVNGSSTPIRAEN